MENAEPIKSWRFLPVHKDDTKSTLRKLIKYQHDKFKRMQTIKTILKELILSFFLVVLSQAASAQNKNITIDKKEATIRELLEEIQEQTDLNIAYKKSDIDKKRKIDVNFQNETVEHVLNVLLEDSGLTYKIKGNYIVIYPIKDIVEPEILTQTIRGVVYNVETGSPIAL